MTPATLLTVGEKSLDDLTPNRSPQKPPRKNLGRTIAWILWLVVAALSGMSLQHYQIDNDLGSWVPDLEAVGAIKSYTIVGFERNAFSETEVAASLRKQPSVSFCLDSAYVERIGRSQGIAPENFVVSEDGTYAGIFVFRNANYDDETFVRQIHVALAEYDRSLDRFALAGPAVFHVSLNAFSQLRLPIIMLLINLMGGVWLWSITGNPKAAVTGVAAIVLSQAVLLGIVSWQRIPVDMSLSMIPPLIMALGYSYAAHRTLRRGVTGTLLLCCGTTAAGIASAGISDLVPLRMFALYGTLGMALVWLAVVTLMPAPAPRARSSRPPARWFEPLLRCNLAIVHRHGNVVVLVCVFITIASVVAIPYLHFESNPLAFFPSDARITRDFSTIDARLTGTLPFQVTVTGLADPTKMLQNTVGVRKILNVSTIVGGDHATYWGLAQGDALPDLVSAQEEWHAWANTNHVQLQWRGIAAQITATGRILRLATIVTLPAMAIIAAISIGCLTWSLRMAFVAAWVNLLPVCCLILIAAIAQVSIGLPSFMIGAIAIGMAIDDTVHLASSVQQRRGVARGLMRCWRPCVGSTFVSASCLALFALSPFGPTRQFGILLGSISLCALTVDMLLFCVLCDNKGTRKPRTRGGSPRLCGQLPSKLTLTADQDSG